MCFSPQASFGAAAVLSTIGIVTIKQVKEKRQLPFAFIPFLFAVQQFSEGVLWLTLDKPGQYQWQISSAYFFLAFAQVVWPLWVPIAITAVETNPLRKKIMIGITVVGVIFSAMLCYGLVFYHAYVNLDCYHIQYVLLFPDYMSKISIVVYPLTTIVPGLVSSLKRMRIMGILLALSLISVELIYTRVVISVWCFFAALLSVYVYFIIKGMRKAISV
jgi:hypothetical protein